MESIPRRWAGRSVIGEDLVVGIATYVRQYIQSPRADWFDHKIEVSMSPRTKALLVQIDLDVRDPDAYGRWCYAQEYRP